MELSEELENVKSELDTQRTLNENLENDLLQLNHIRNGATNTASEKNAISELNLMKKSEVCTLSLAAEFYFIAFQTDSSDRSTPIPFLPSADMSILPIVTSQRDRFRQRNAELEDVRIYIFMTCFLLISCKGTA